MGAKRSAMLPEQQREARERAKERYAKDRKRHILRVYLRLLEAGKIRCPRQSTVERYGLIEVDGRWRVSQPTGSEN